MILVNNDDDFQRFYDINITTLIKHAPSKKKYARWNQMFFLTKDLSKAIMARFRLCNNFLNNKKEVNRALYVLSNFVQNLNISLFPDSDPSI